MNRLAKTLFSTALLLTVLILLPLGFHSADADIAAKGTWGDLVWHYSAGTLTVSGNSAMPDFSSAGSADAWRGYKDLITTVVINDGVTSIGENAFAFLNSLTKITVPESVVDIGPDAFIGCSGLTSAGPVGSGSCYEFAWTESIPDHAFRGTYLTHVVLPSGITRIGNYAFYNITALTGITIPSSVRSIGDYAFCACHGLQSVVIPSGVTDIGENVFESCTGLTRVSISSSVTGIGEKAFLGCSSLTGIDVDDANADYCSQNGVLFDKSRTVIRCFPAGLEGDYTIPSGVTNIGNYAFYECRKLTGVTIPPSVSTIGDQAFLYCSGLKRVTIPSGVTNLGLFSFQECGLTEVTVLPGVTSIGYGMFLGCPGLTSVTIPSSVTYISYGAFANCGSLTDVYFGGSEEEWETTHVEESNDPLLRADIHFSEAPTRLYSGAWGDLSWTLDLDGTLTVTGSGPMPDFSSYESTDAWRAYRALIKTVVIDDGVTGIGKYAFTDLDFMTRLTVPGSVTEIAADALLGCMSLTTAGPIGSGCCYEFGWTAGIPDHAFHGTQLTGVVIPYGITRIGNYAFFNITSLKDVTIPSSVTSIGDSAFYACYGLENLVIPFGVTSIGEEAFFDCASLTGISIPSSVTGIGERAFIGCSSLTEINVDDANAYFSDLDGVLFNKDRTVLLCFPAGRGGDYSIPAGVTDIGNSAFSRCEDLTGVTIPSSVSMIGDQAFLYCSALGRVTIPSAVTYIGASAFQETGLTDVTILPGLTEIGFSMFYACADLQTVTIPASVTYISYGAFAHCDSLARVYFDGKQQEWEAISVGDDNDPLTSATVFYAAVRHFTVAYDANGGTGAPETQYKLSGTDLILSDLVPSRADSSAGGFTVTLNANGGSVSPSSLTSSRTTAYVFAGWNTRKDGSGTGYAPGAGYTPDADVTLYAQWNASTLTPAVTLPTPTWSGHVFRGWAEDGSASSGITGSFTPNGDITLYAAWEEKIVYTVSYDANGGTGTPSSQTKEEGVPLALSSFTPSKKYVLQYNANGGSVSPAGKTVSCTFENWNTALDGSGASYAPGSSYTANANVTLYAQWTDPAAGTLATPTRNGFEFTGWFTAAVGGVRNSDSAVVTGDMTLYAHWMDPYNMFDETYSFANYQDSDSRGGHCFGMSITSSGYHTSILDIGRIGGSSNTPLYSFGSTASVRQPICYYQGVQGLAASNAIVAGGTFYLFRYSNITADWQEVVSYVRNHDYDAAGLLQIGIRRNSEGGHAVNFLRYENVNGQDRIYAYDNNFPQQETWFYQDSSGYVRQAPVQTFSGPIDCIALRDIRIYYNHVGEFDITHVLYMPKDASTVEGYTPSCMDGSFADEEYVMYEIPSDRDRVIIDPNRDYADFIYMDTEYSFGEITDDTRGELRFVSMNEGAGSTGAVFRIFEIDPAFGEPDVLLPASLTEIEESAFEGTVACTVYIPDSCVSIGEYAFRNAALTRIRIPAVCTIADTAFDGCGNVEIFGTPGSAAETFCDSHDNCTFIAESQ